MLSATGGVVSVGGQQYTLASLNLFFSYQWNDNYVATVSNPSPPPPPRPVVQAAWFVGFCSCR